MSEDLDEFLSHYGVKGMRWGVRKSRSERKAAREARKKGGAAKDSGPGKRTYDARKLSNKELKSVVARMELEQRYNKLNNSSTKKGESFVKKSIKEYGKQSAPKLIAAGSGAAVALALGNSHKGLDSLVDKNFNVNWKAPLTK